MTWELFATVCVAYVFLEVLFSRCKNIGRYFKSSTKPDLLTFVTHNLLLIASTFNVECFYSYVIFCTSYACV